MSIEWVLTCDGCGLEFKTPEAGLPSGHDWLTLRQLADRIQRDWHFCEQCRTRFEELPIFAPRT